MSYPRRMWSGSPLRWTETPYWPEKSFRHRLGLAIYVPLESKDAANGVSSEIKGLLEKSGHPSTAQFHLAGLPLAEEAFGRDMFLQMALLAPLAGLLVFLLMFFFFRKLTLVIPALLVAMLSVFGPWDC